MSEFFLELFSEEIPSRLQINARNELTQIFKKFFDDNEIILKPNTSALDIEDWDSLMQITLLITIEKHFKLKFNPEEIQKLNNIFSKTLFLKAIFLQ